MKRLGCLARTQGDIEAEFAESSRQAGGKAGSVDAVEMIGTKVGIGDASPEHPICGREDGGGNCHDGLARPTSCFETANRARR